MNYINYSLGLLLVVFFISCQEETEFTNDSSAKLNFSTDTVLFDTVFSSIGSITKSFKIYNHNSNAIKTNVKLASGSNSYYRLNIDGYSANELDDLEILGNDSAYIFVEVTVDPQNSNSPVVISDSISFYTNGNTQFIQLVSFGQDVHLYNNEVIETTNWTNDKPYLVYNRLVVDTLQKLTIDPGVRVYFHDNASLFIKGTLEVNGTNAEHVYFQGDRFDDWYGEIPGQWGNKGYDEDGNVGYFGGIQFMQGSIENKINYAEIKNGTIGIQLYPLEVSTSNPTLILSNSIISNMSYLGISSYTNVIAAYNTVIVNCGYYCAQLAYGGSYEFYHCTLGNYFSEAFGTRETPALLLNNYANTDSNVTIFPLYAHFGNSIIYGDSHFDDELIIDSVINQDADYDVVFDHCLIKLSSDFDTTNHVMYKDIICHVDSLPRFVNTELIDFRLDTLSAAKDKGSTEYSTIFKTDLDGNDRTTDGKPDLGAYERIQ